MSRTLPRINIALWTLTLLVVAWVGFGDRLLTHWAYAVERGRIQASDEELAALHEDLPEVYAVSRAFKLAAKVARPGVVHLYVSGDGPDDPNASRLPEDLPQELRGVPREQLEYWLRRPTPGMGSGVIFDDAGYILTNNHVVENSSNIRVMLYDDREYAARVVGTDWKTDLAVLKIDAPDLHALKLADSDKVEVGDWVIAVGAPFGLSQTVTHGIVSAKGRSSVAGIGIYYQDFIQTDAAINPGNSGGPLLNLHGEVIGLNTAIATHGDAYNAGVAFTIPANLAKKVANQLKTHGEVRRGWLGILHTPVDPGDVDLFGLPDTHGTIVTGVLKGSPAELGGLQVEDAIVAVNGVSFRTNDQFQSLVADISPGEVARFDVVRNGERIQVAFELGLQPDEFLRARTSERIETIPVPGLGLGVQTLRPLRSGIWLTYDEEQRGAAVAEITVRGAERPDIRPGELIVSCNGRDVETARDLLEAQRSTPVGSRVRVEVLEPGGDRRMITIKKRPD